MDEQLRIILIIIVSVSIFGLLVFVFVRNYLKNKISQLLKMKKKIKVNSLSLNNHPFQYPLLFLMFQNQNHYGLIVKYLFYKITTYYLGF